MGVKSPLTGTDDTTYIRQIDVTRLIRDWKNSFGIDITSEMKGASLISEYQCNVTKLYFFVPLTVDGSGKLYEELEKFDWYYMPEKWEHRLTLKRLKPASKILEIGCGEGGFIDLCKKNGHTATGIELNKRAVLKAREKGLEIFEKDLHKLANEQENLNYYDCVCSYQVLEHISNPKEFINSCIKLVKPGGQLIFCVPNSNGLLATDYSLLDMPPHHMTRWNKSSFKSLEDFWPVKLERLFYEPLARYHWDWYLNVVKENVPGKMGRKIFLSSKALKMFKWFLSHGFNRFIKGHTIYVEFQKKK